MVGYFKSDPYQFRVTGALVETILLFLMILWNGFLYKRELRLTLHEMTNRASTIIAALERSGMNMVQVGYIYICVCVFDILVAKVIYIYLHLLYLI